MAVIIISGYEEPLMELEASRYQAVFVGKPLRPAVFLQTVAESLSGVRRERRWPRKRVIGGFRVTAAGKPAAVVDVWYGGLRLQVPKGTELAQVVPRGARRHRPAVRRCRRCGRARPTTATTRSAARRSRRIRPRQRIPGARSSIACRREARMWIRHGSERKAVARREFRPLTLPSADFKPTFTGTAARSSSRHPCAGRAAGRAVDRAARTRTRCASGSA